MSRIIPIPRGTRFGLWVVQSFAGLDDRHNAKWWCTCDGCGRDFPVYALALKTGKSTKCVHCAAEQRRSRKT